MPRYFRGKVIHAGNKWDFAPIEDSFFRATSYYKILSQITDFVFDTNRFVLIPPLAYPIVIKVDGKNISRSPIKGFYKLSGYNGESLLGALTDSDRLILLSNLE